MRGLAIASSQGEPSANPFLCHRAGQFWGSPTLYGVSESAVLRRRRAGLSWTRRDFVLGLAVRSRAHVERENGRNATAAATFIRAARRNDWHVCTLGRSRGGSR